MRSLRFIKTTAAKLVLLLCVLTPALPGCNGTAELMSAVNSPSLAPAPRTPGARITETHICIPHQEAAELLLWIENAEETCR